MSDVCDKADELIEMNLQHGIAAALQSKPVGKQTIINGVVVCWDCDEPIPLKRLEKMPDAVRCVPCQTDHEKGRG